MYSYLPHTEEDISEMLAVIGVKGVTISSRISLRR
jgi:hypothetical protein